VAASNQARASPAGGYPPPLRKSGLSPEARCLAADVPAWRIIEHMFETIDQELIEDLPGPDLVVRLAKIPVDDLSPMDQIIVLQAWERVASWVAACQQRVLVVVAGDFDGRDGGDDWGCEEVAAALHVSGRTAGSRLAVARSLERLPSSAAALAAGRISYWHAVVLTDELHALQPETAAVVEAAVLPHAGDQTPGALRRAVRRAVARVDPLSIELAHQRAVDEQGVRSWPLPDGMAMLAATLPAADAAVCMAALDALARGPAQDGRSHDGTGGIDARRADALVDLCSSVLADPTLPRAHGHRPAVRVQIDLATLLGLADHPGELAGYGPIPASAARALAAQEHWQRLVTDPLTGATLDLGRQSYTPSQALADFVLARDGTCRFPGCAQQASRCHLDHAIPYREGGPTDRQNLGLLCQRHHRLKHEAGRRLERHPDDSCTWTSAAGARYRVPPSAQTSGAVRPADDDPVRDQLALDRTTNATTGTSSAVRSDERPGNGASPGASAT